MFEALVTYMESLALAHADEKALGRFYLSFLCMPILCALQVLRAFAFGLSLSYFGHTVVCSSQLSHLG